MEKTLQSPGNNIVNREYGTMIVTIVGANDKTYILTAHTNSGWYYTIW